MSLQTQRDLERDTAGERNLNDGLAPPAVAPGKISRSASLTGPGLGLSSGIVKPEAEPAAAPSPAAPAISVAGRPQPTAPRERELLKAAIAQQKAQQPEQAETAAPDAPPAPGPIARTDDPARENGVAPGADGAVAEASASSGSALPATLQRKFEASLGADLRNVRVHDGARSSASASAVGARAYALGQDIHFNAGEYAPSTPEGERLLAHEVAHTVQQAGGVGRKPMFKLDVSTPGDAHEAEADRAADSMVAGAAAEVAPADGMARSTLMREEEKKPDGGNKDGTAWKGGTALQEDEVTKFASEKASLVSSSIGLVSLATGWKSPLDPGVLIVKLQEDAQGQYEARVRDLKATIEWLKGEQKSLSKIPEGQRTAEQRRHAAVNPLDPECYVMRWGEAVNELEKLENTHTAGWDRAVGEATQIISSVTGVAGKISSFAGDMNNVFQLANPELFTGLNGAISKIDAAIGAVNTARLALDRTAFDNFAKNPSLETCEAWGSHVSSIFGSLAGLAATIPLPGWGAVMSGMMSMPAAVTSAFAKVMRERYEKIDRMSTDPFGGKDPRADPANILPD